MKKFILNLIVLILYITLSVTVHAQFTYQVKNSYSVFNTGWSSISGSGSQVSFTSFTNENSTAVSIGFSFNFNGKNYSTCIINSNGFIKLGNSNPSSSSLYMSSPTGKVGGALFSTSSGDSDIISVFNHELKDDGSGNTGVYTQTDGSAPNRVFTVEWNKFKDASASPAEQFSSMSFQIKMHENSGIIQFVYGDFTSTSNSTMMKTAAVGIRGSGTEMIHFTKSYNKGWATCKVMTDTNSIFEFSNSSLPSQGDELVMVPVQTKDILISRVVSPDTSQCVGGKFEKITFRIYNNGTDTIFGNKDSFTVSGKVVNPSSTEISIGPVTYNTGFIAPGSYTDVVVHSNFNMIDHGDYTISGYISSDMDFNIYNDSISSVLIKSKGLSPVITSTGNGTKCAGDTVYLDAAQTTGATSISWYYNGNIISGNTSLTLNVTQAGNYQIYASNTLGCMAYSDTMEVSYLYTPAPDISYNAPGYCQGDSAFFAVTNQKSGSSFSWKIGSQMISNYSDSFVYINQAGMLYVTVTDSKSGCKGYDSLTVQSFSMPDTSLTVSGSITLCPGDSVKVSATQNTAYGIQWYKNGMTLNGFTSPDISINATGYYKAEITDISTGCMAFTRTIYVTVNAPPSIKITLPGNTNVICQPDSIELSATSNSNYNYVWYDDYGIINNVSGNILYAKYSSNYIVKVTDGNGCTNSDTSSIIIKYAPVLQIQYSGSTTICSGDQVDLFVTGDSGYTYQWVADSQNLQSAKDTFYTVTAGGLYSIKVTYDGCTGESAGLYITELSLPGATIGYSTDSLACQGDSVELYLTATSSVAKIVWMYNNYLADSNGLTLYQAKNVGNYWAIVTGTNGCVETSNTKYADIIQGPVPVIYGYGGSQFCTGDSVMLETDTSGGYTFQWKVDGNTISGANQYSYFVKSSGNYTVVVSNSGCDGESGSVNMVELAKPQALLLITGKDTVCMGDSIQLNASSNISVSQIEWKKDGNLIPGAGSTVFYAKDFGVYTVRIKATNGCTNESGGKVLSFNSGPIPVLKNSTFNPFCASDSVKLETDSMAGYIYNWTINGNTISGSNKHYIYVSGSGDYAVEAFYNGCWGESSPVTIQVLNQPGVQLITPSGNSTCQGDSIPLHVSARETIQDIQWIKDGTDISGASATVYYSFNKGVYTVRVKGTNGCIETAKPVNIDFSARGNTGSIAGRTSAGLNNVESYSVKNVSGVTYIWEVTGGNIITQQGLNSVQIQWSSPGNGKISVTGNCLDTSILQVSVLTGINNPELTQVNIYPNPGKGLYQIEAVEVVRIFVYDMSGARIPVIFNKTEKGGIIDMTQASAGVYMAEIVLSGGERIVRKIVFQ